nr:probable serine carboxypeptidase CPVL [Dermacentor andersoni]
MNVIFVSSTGSGPLFLTPLIEENNCNHARTISRVKLFKNEVNVTAHSGFITVNKTLGSHLFFLYIRAQGGPGLSSLFGQFLEIGPLAINSDGSLSKRLRTIQKNVSVIYLDVPVGAGYSFTKNPSGYAHSLEDISAAVTEFLGQFLILFPEYKERDFYVAGESYGGQCCGRPVSQQANVEEGQSGGIEKLWDAIGVAGPNFRMAQVLEGRRCDKPKFCNFWCCEKFEDLRLSEDTPLVSHSICSQTRSNRYLSSYEEQLLGSDSWGQSSI